MAEDFDLSGWTQVDTGEPAVSDAPAKAEDPFDMNGWAPVQPRRKPTLSPEEVLEIAENEPDRFRAAMEKVRARENKGVVERLNEYQGPLLRGMARGGQSVGNFVVNSVMRGVSYIPGMEHLADKADHANRLAAIQAAYDSYQDENSLTSEFIGATGAKLTGSLGETVSTGLLSGGAGRALGAANTTKGMTAFMAASYGAMDMDRHLTIGKDAGLTEAQKNIYATGMGGLSAGLTFAFGRVGEKLGGHTMEELLARGAGRSLASLATREGLKRELMDTALEGTEEGTVALAQAAYTSMFGVEDDVDYIDRFKQGFLGGVVGRAGMGIGRRLPDKFMQVLEKVEPTYKGWKLAQTQAEGKVTAEEAKVQAEAEGPDVKVAYEAEIAALGKQQKELESKLDPFVTRRAELDKTKADLATRKAQLAEEEAGLAQTPAAMASPPEVAALIERRRADIADMQAEYDEVLAKSKNKKTAKDLREEYAATASELQTELQTELETAKSKLASWESEAAKPTGKSQYVDFYDRFPDDRYGEKMTIATMRDMFPELDRKQFDEMVLKMAKEGRLSLMAATTDKLDERISSGGIPSSTGRMRHIMFVKDPTKLPGVPTETTSADPAKSADVEARKAKLTEEEAGLTKQEELLMAEEQAAQADIQKRRDFLNAEMERYTARQEKVEQGEAFDEATAAKQEFIERDRKKFGLDELPPLEAQAWLDALQTARAKGIPQKALTVAKEAIGSNDIWDSETTIGVTAGYDLVKQQWLDNRDKLAKATTDVERESYMAMDKDIVNDLNIMSEAIHRVGTGQGRALAIRKFILPVDGDPDIVIKRARKSKGEALSNEETRGIMEASAIVKKLIGERDALTPGTKEFDDKNFELYEARLRLENFENLPGTSTLKDKASMVNYLWRDLVTGIDMAVAGIQGGLSLLSRPQVAVPAMWKGFKSHIDERGAIRADYDLFNRKNGDLYRDKVITINPEGPLLRNEDLAMQSMYGPWSKIPGVQPFLNFWPRIYRGMVNQLRADMFDAMLESAGGRGSLPRAAIEDLGHLTDVMTGRGGRGYLDKHVSTLNLLMFAPRYSFSQAEFLIGKPIWGASKESRKYVMKEYGRILTSWLSLYTAAALGNVFSNAAGEGDIMETVWDPTDSNFMKIKIGETWVDPTFRLGRWVSAAGQTSAAIYNNVTGTRGVPVVGLDGKAITVGQSPAGLDSRRAGSFVRGKLSLPVGSLVDLTTGTYMTGEKVVDDGGLPQFAARFAKNRVAPIAPKEILEAMVERGVSQQLAVALLGFIGAPVKPVYPPKVTPTRRNF